MADELPTDPTKALSELHLDLVDLANTPPGVDAHTKAVDIYTEVAKIVADASKDPKIISAVQAAVVMLPGKWQAIIGVIFGLVVALSGFVGGRATVSTKPSDGHTIVQNFGDGASPVPAGKTPEPIPVRRKIVLYADDAAKAKAIVDSLKVPFDVSVYPKTYVAGQSYRFQGHDVLVPYAAVIDTTGIVLAAEPYTDAKSVEALAEKVK